MTKLNLNFNKKISLSNRVSSVGYINKSMFYTWVRLLIWSLSLPKAPYMKLANRLFALWTVNGPTFVVKYSKECTRILQAYVSGFPILQTSEFVVGIKGGIPSIIPGTLSSKIRSKDLDVIRGVLSLLSVFRVIQIPGKVKISTITDPFKGLCTTLPYYEVFRAASELKCKHFKLFPMSLKLLSTAGPNHPVSMLGITKDIMAWKGFPELFGRLRLFLSKSPGGTELLSLIDQEIEYIGNADKSISNTKELILGKLSLKNEAAGKVRVFAITDSITQSAFGPLSDGVFRLLKNLPMDGTFDQDAPVRRLVSILKKREDPSRKVFSYDLSAATDRLPLDFQVQVLSSLIGEDQAKLWGEILTNRPWFLFNEDTRRMDPYYYSVGQPMGALSSWAMLALSHHFIVRIAANRVGIRNFGDYALLGDDIVIANENVAIIYHELMTKILGVEINLSKSLISTDSFEFAKRLVTTKGEVSPVGAKNLLVAIKTLKGIPSVLLDLSNKGFNFTEELLESMMNNIPTVRKTHGKKLLWLIQGPFGFVSTTDGLSASKKLSSSLTVVGLSRLLQSFEEVIYRANSQIWERNMAKVDDIIASLLRSEDNGWQVDCLNSPIFQYFFDYYYDQWSTLLSERPDRRPFFGGLPPGVHISSPHFQRDIMNFITNVVKSKEGITFSPVDPFQEEKVVLPLSHSAKVENFWLEVAKVGDNRSPLQPTRRGVNDLWKASHGRGTQISNLRGPSPMWRGVNMLSS